MSDLDAALEPVREILARRDAARRNGTSESDSLKKLIESAAALLERPEPATAVNGSEVDWALYEQNRVEIQAIVKRLRSAGH